MAAQDVFILAEVDREDFMIIGVFSTFEKATSYVKGKAPIYGRYWIERHPVDGEGSGCAMWMSKDGETWKGEK
jgi:hypothetical protein